MSTRLEYDVDSLRHQIGETFLRRVEEAEAEHAESLNLGRRRDEWRAEAEQQVRRLAERLESAADNELESFRIKKCPRIDRFDSPDRYRDQAIEKAEASRDRALARLESVKAPNGVLSLTANMLRDWFGL